MDKYISPCCTPKNYNMKNIYYNKYLLFKQNYIEIYEIVMLLVHIQLNISVDI